MQKHEYRHLEQFYIYPQYIEKYNLEKHLHDIQEIINTNPIHFSELKTKKYYYFRMPLCGHPEFISLTKLRTKIYRQESLCCRICKWFVNSEINYKQFAKLYSIQNKTPLSNINYRNHTLLLTCQDCKEDTPYKEARWVLYHLKFGENFKNFCRRRCYSIGEKHPNLIPFWNENKNKAQIFTLQANDQNLYRSKFYFYCFVCGNIIDTPMTVINAIRNSARCSEHKVKQGTSFAEMAIFLSFFRCLSNLPFIGISHKYKYNGKREFDIYVTVSDNNKHSYFAVEVDGIQHSYTIKGDEDKNNDASRSETHLERVRDVALKGITLNDFHNIIQRNSKDKEELNNVIVELLKRFMNWAVNLNIQNPKLEALKNAVLLEMKTANVIEDEKYIFQNFLHKSGKLLKDNLKLKPIYDQLREDVRTQLGNYITTSEQDVKRPFICSTCNEEWYQYVHVVVKNYNKSKNGAMGCPTCANKNFDYISELKLKAIDYKKLGLTQVEIGKILGRSQPTISDWLKNTMHPNNSDSE
ncbi:helix-turn-helix transcriptional regulator [Lysinibacillus sp. IITD104]|uniref:helix-turn-helix domain-containing protein n=1 Tax=Lysinibacillus sp. IITD104 TaxID=3116650 RepID=UPI002FD039B8